MIGRAITTAGSLSAFEYAEKDNKKSYGISYNLFGDTYKDQWNEMREIASLNSTVQRKKYVNAMISFDRSQNPAQLSSNDLKNIAERYAKELGFFNNQWKFAVHSNTDELHIHFFANRIGFNGKNTVKASNIGKRSGQIVDSIANSFGFRTAKQISQERKAIILECLLKNLHKSSSWEELQKRMLSQGFILQLHQNKNGVSGARIISSEFYKEYKQLSEREKNSYKGYKLSDISRKHSIKSIQSILNNNYKREFSQQRTKRKHEISTGSPKLRQDEKSSFKLRQ